MSYFHSKLEVFAPDPYNYVQHAYLQPLVISELTIKPSSPTLRPVRIELLWTLRRNDIPKLTRGERYLWLVRIECIKARIQRFRKAVHLTCRVQLEPWVSACVPFARFQHQH